MIKYPRTQHIEGSRLQPGDHDLEQVSWASLMDCHLVVEEKIDGANAGVSFSPEGELLLQSRGHYLSGGAREKHFAMFKTWTSTHREALHSTLGDRYIMYGEWVYAKHTIFYDLLPHYFLEFDIYDTRTGAFLDTPARQALLADTPVVSVPVIQTGQGRQLPQPQTMVSRSMYKSDDWKASLSEQAATLALNTEQVFAQTDLADEAEGLYIKVEEEGVVAQRLKWVRHSFLTTVVESGSHWLNRPIVPNLLRADTDIFKGQL